MSNDLNLVRNEIDEVDRELIKLMKKRLNLVAKVGEIKRDSGVPVYAPNRESEMLKKRRLEAENEGIPPQLIEDVLRRIMRESYQSEHDAGFKCVNPSDRNIVIIGGNGQLGSIFVRMFRLSGYKVDVLSRKNWDDFDIVLKNPCLVIVCVPIDVTIDIIHSLKNLPDDCVLADFTSIKQKPIDAMLEVHKGPVIGLHPMFGPDIASLAKQVVVCCKGRYQDKCEWILSQIRIWGARIEQVSAEEHDKAMCLIQALRHFTTYAYGVYLSKTNVELNKLISLSSPIYRLELMMVGRLFAQDPNLYADIILSAQRNIENIEKYCDSINEAVKLVKSADKKDFVDNFLKARDFFGEYSQKFLMESKLLLDSARDHIVHESL